MCALEGLGVLCVLERLCRLDLCVSVCKGAWALRVRVCGRVLCVIG